jgi:UDP-N-acetylglucosamine:LPS N-acetylglucosamine transferase
MLRHPPWLYQGIFAAFFGSEHPAAPGVYPLDVLAGHRLRPLLDGVEGVVSTFHLAGQIAGRLRCRGLLRAPSVVVITEPALHRQWIHPGTDLYLCPYPWLATAIRDRTSAEALTPGPVVDPRFHLPADTGEARAALGLRDGEYAVLVSAGGWGTGAAARTAALLSQIQNVRPMVLCGRNRSLRADIAAIPGCTALGWRDDLPRLFAGARVLVDQSGGGTCAEAFAAGLAVILHQPLPGHGRLGARTLAAHGMVTLAPTPADLLEQVRRAVTLGPSRQPRQPRPADIFTADPVSTLLDWTHRSAGSGPTAPCRRPQ